MDSFLDYFYTNLYDDKIIIKNADKSFTVRRIKEIISGEAAFLKGLSEENILIFTENVFEFIIIFLSCIFAGKKVIISNNNNKTAQSEIKTACTVSNLSGEKAQASFVFPEINPGNVEISIYTSGTTSAPKIIKKNLSCILKEANDVISALCLKKENPLEFILTTPVNHLYAITAFIFVPLNSGNIINTERIGYFEELTVPNSVLITSPSFLNYMQKHALTPEIHPELILSAGANLKKETHEYFEKFSKVINFYGCTETGFIACKEKSFEEKFKLLSGIKIVSTEPKTVVNSAYSLPEAITLGDNIILHPDNFIELKGRMDRLFKIQEKRVSADEIEEEIKKNPFVKNCRLVNLEDKIGAMVELTESGVQFFLKNSAPSLVENLKANLLNKFQIVPQRWKFIDEIPANDLGKPDTQKIEEIFGLNLSLPLILKRSKMPETAEYDLYFYKNCNFFKGHFDEFPITPGVVQLFYAAFFAKIAFGLQNCETGQIKRIKFSNIIRPNTLVTLKLTKSEKNIEFEYKTDETLYSSGSLPVQNIFEGRL